MNRKTYNEEMIENEISEIDNEYSFIRIIEFNGSSSKILIRHNTCNREIEIRFNNFKYCGRRCKYCNSRRIDERKFIKMINERDNNYELVGNYNGLTNYVIFNHKSFNHTFKMKPNDFLYNNYRCPICAGKFKHNFESLSKRIENKNSDYKLISIPDNFKGISRSKVTIEHKCGFKMNIIPNNFLTNNAKCPICYKRRMFNAHNLSHGANIIKNFLIKYKIPFEMDKKFEGLRSPFTNRYLRIDFYLKDQNIAIEFDGKQHFGYSKSSKIFTKERYEKQKIYDNIKNKYCEDNNIKLIRISYKDYNNKIIIKKLKKELTFNDYRKE